MPGNSRLSEEMVREIANETHPERELSQSEIERLASSLNIDFVRIMNAANNFFPSRHPRNCASK